MGSYFSDTQKDKSETFEWNSVKSEFRLDLTIKLNR